MLHIQRKWLDERKWGGGGRTNTIIQKFLPTQYYLWKRMSRNLLPLIKCHYGVPVGSQSDSFLLCHDGNSFLLSFLLFLYVFDSQKILRWYGSNPQTFFFLNGCTHGIWKFLGQGLNMKHNCSLCHGCGNTGSLTCCDGDQTFSDPSSSRDNVGSLICGTTVGTPKPTNFFPYRHTGKLGVKLELRLPAYTTAHSHGNTRPEPNLQPTSQPAATLDP